MDFNPLDLLAAAAALQRDDPKKVKQSGGKNQSETDCDDKNTDEEATEEEDSNKSDKMGSARKVRTEIRRQNSCNLPSDVGKLFGTGSGSSDNVDTVTEDDLPGRTQRRHSWSAERVSVNSSSAHVADITGKNSGGVSAIGNSQKVCSGSDNVVSQKQDSDDQEESVDDSGTLSPECGQSSDLPDVQTEDSNIHKSASESEISYVPSEETKTDDVSCDASVSDIAPDDETEERLNDDENDNNDSGFRSACCPLCHKPKNETSDEVSGLDGLCLVCQKRTLPEDHEAASPSGPPEMPSPGAAGSCTDLTKSEQSESCFVAIVDDRTSSESSETQGSSCLLESYLTSMQTGNLQTKLATEKYTGQSSIESMDSMDYDARDGCSGVGTASSVVSDHSYASQPGKIPGRPSADCYDIENGAESDSGGENSSAEEVEHRARSMSIESACLRFGFDEKQMTLPVKRHEDSDQMSNETSLLSPTSSVDSSLTDYPSLKLTPLSIPDKSVESTAQQHTFLQGYSSSDGCDDRLGSPTSSIESLHGQIPSKIGKFRIGTFASFSNSSVKSETLGLKNGSKSIRIKDHSTLSSPLFDKGLLGSPPMSVPQSPGIPSFLQSPCGDWDRSDAGSEVQDELGPPHCSETLINSGSQESSESGSVDTASVHHDHDYCLREGHLPKDFGLDTGLGKPERRKYSSWAKTKSGIVRHIKEPKMKSKTKVKKIKTELLESPTLAITPPEEVQDFKQPFEVDISQDRTTVISRTSRRRLEKLQEQLELDNGSKLKITGKFKDEYVYYLNKSSRSRRRASTDLPPPPPTDKIILPAPKPGDIIVPHLTDADIEAIKLRGKSGLSISEKYYGAGLSSALHSTSVASSTHGPSQTPAPHPENMADMDSKIISTILSMENDSLGSPASAHESSLSDTMDLYSPSEESVGISFMGENMTLTPDQVNMLLDAVKDVETTPEEIIDSTGAVKYNLDNNQNYDQPVEHLEISTSDQKSVDGMSTADETERRQSVSSAASELETESKDDSEITETETAVAAESTPVSVPVVTSAQTVTETTVPTVQASAQTAVVVPPTVNPNESPVKALLEADLQTIGDSTPLRDLIPTIEKPFDLLGNDFRLDKSDLFPDAAVMEHTTPCAATNSAASDYNTPWIVTVTMFWNDLPAIMIENQPFVRLVDIHKQILPAKDTGILKKRCQLLGIDVLNCSEMQRYFLVQYGRAYNSKSTLIVSKDDAKGLIGYYVNPQPRVAKLDDMLRRGEDPEVSSDGSVASHHSVENHPVKIAAPAASKKKIRPKAHPKVSAVIKTEVIPAPLPAVPQSVDIPLPVTEIVKEIAPPQESKRLRHKKINFLELLKGEVNSDSNSVPDSEEKKFEKDDEITGESSRRSSVSPSSPNSKKKTKLSDAEKLKLVKEELKKRKIELPEESASEKKIPRVVEQDSEEENNSTPSGRRRFGGPKPRGSNSPINGNRRSRLKKVGPLKVKIKGLLHFSKGNKKNTRDSDNKIIEIRHKDPKPTNAHPSVTQDGDIHLDLYQKKSSLCIKCCSCKKFFSLRNFLTHQHYPDDTEILTTVAQPQVLEPRNNKLSEKKKILWQEFNKRRKQLEGIKTVNDPKPIVLSKPLNIVNKSVIPTSPSVPVAPSVPSEPDTVQTPPPHEDISGYKPGSALEAELRKKTDIPRFKQPVTVTMPSRRKPTSSGVRVSSRKRKERQLFPIENYSFTKKAARLDLPLNGDADMDLGEGVSVAPAEKAAAAAVASNCVLTLSNGPELTHYTALQDAPEM